MMCYFTRKSHYLLLYFQVGYDDTTAKSPSKWFVHPSALTSCTVHTVHGQGADDVATATGRLAAFMSMQTNTPISELVADYVKDAAGVLTFLQIRAYKLKSGFVLRKLPAPATVDVDNEAVSADLTGPYKLGTNEAHKCRWCLAHHCVQCTGTFCFAESYFSH